MLILTHRDRLLDRSGRDVIVGVQMVRDRQSLSRSVPR